MELGNAWPLCALYEDVARFLLVFARDHLNESFSCIYYFMVCLVFGSSTFGSDEVLRLSQDGLI